MINDYDDQFMISDDKGWPALSTSYVCAWNLQKHDLLIEVMRWPTASEDLSSDRSIFELDTVF